MAIRWLAKRTPGLKRIIAERNQFREDRIQLRTALADREQRISDLLFLLSEETTQRKLMAEDLAEERQRRRHYGQYVRQLKARLQRADADIGAEQAARTLHPTAVTRRPAGAPSGRPAPGRPDAGDEAIPGR
jgi:septal ring factor EnvC (AmiA/AmiB activator)